MNTIHTLIAGIGFALVVGGVCGQAPMDKAGTAAGSAQAGSKLDRATLDRLIELLKHPDSKTRDQATQELSKLDDVPEKLRAAAHSDDLETRRRAQVALERITKRLEEKAYQAVVAELHQVELDRLVRKIVTEHSRADAKEWAIIQTVAKAVAKRASELAGRQLPVPDFDLKSLAGADFISGGASVGMKRWLVKNGGPAIPSPSASVILCTGPTTGSVLARHSLLIVDGDFPGETVVDHSIVIVRGNVGRVTSVRGSIILATGNFAGATSCDDSIIQVANQRVRFTGSRNSVVVKSEVMTTGPTTSKTLDTDQGPLQLLKFTPRKADAELAWGKESNGMALAIFPAEQKHRFFVRWKNVGKETLEAAIMRPRMLNSNFDPLLNHVLLRDAAGKLAATRWRPAAGGGASSTRLDSIVLGPGHVHEESFDLWEYVEKPMRNGRYQLAIEQFVERGFQREPDARPWFGKIESNVLEVVVEK